MAIEPQRSHQYRIDFARNFFASPEAERTARSDLDITLKELEAQRGKIGTSADSLYQALQLFDRVEIKLARHYAYLYLRYATNTKDEASLADSSAIEAAVNARTAFLRRELLELDELTLSAFFSKNPSLRQYRFAIEAIRRYQPYTLSLKEEELLSAVATVNRDWQYELYEKLLARTQFGTVKTKNGELNVWKDRIEIASDSAANVREIGFKLRYAGFSSQRDLYAFALIKLAAERTRLAQLRHYADASGEAYFGRYWNAAQVNSLLEQIAQRADLYKRYQRVRADYVKKFTGLKEVNFWDLSVRPEGMQTPRFTIEQASRIIRDALTPLGPAYCAELSALLDPANGRMDIVPGENRKRGGFSQGFIGTDSVFFSGGFAGYYNDVRVLMHESTHAVHRQLMHRSKVLPVYASGPNYLFESFAIFNELLLPDYLYSHTTDPLLKQYYLEQFLEGKGMIMFAVAPEAMLEQAVYEGVAKGSIKGADDLDVLTRRVYSQFSMWMEKHEELKNQWMNIPLMYEDPFYDINYVYGAIVALKFYEMYKRDPGHFIPRYIALMSNGFDAPPEKLLKRFLDVDLDDAQLVNSACRLLQDKVDLLEESYKR